MQTKKLLRDLITDSLNRARQAGVVNFADLPPFDVEAPRQAEHGDFATNAGPGPGQAGQAAAPPGG